MRKIRCEDMKDTPFCTLYVIDDKGVKGENIISSCVMLQEHADAYMKKANADIQKEMDRNDSPVEVKKLGIRSESVL